VLTVLNVHLIYLMTESTKPLFIGYTTALVVLPVFYFYFHLLTATEKSDFSRIQRMLKWLMVSGILSVVLV
jgi:hypothetical protein